MGERLSDDRLVSGAVIPAEIGFTLDTVSSAITLGRDASLEPGCVSLEYPLKPLRDLALEGPIRVLSGLPGVLRVTSQRERTQRLGRLRRDADGYSLEIHLFETELDRFIGFVAAGLKPTTLAVEFDVEVAPWFEMGDYWDDVVYPVVDIHEYRIGWSRTVPPAAGQADGATAADAPQPR